MFPSMLSSSPPALQDLPEICQRVEGNIKVAIISSHIVMLKSEQLYNEYFFIDSLQIRNGENIATVEECDEAASEKGSLKPSDDLISIKTSQDDNAVHISCSSQQLLNKYVFSLRFEKNINYLNF